jgi:hypothetical protein
MKQLSWNILIGKDSKGDFCHMSGKPVGRVWAWFVLASQTQLRLSNQSTFHWKTISNKRWERHLLLCGYIKKRLHNASWHMDLKKRNGWNKNVSLTTLTRIELGMPSPEATTLTTRQSHKRQKLKRNYQTNLEIQIGGGRWLLMQKMKWNKWN